MKRKIGSCPMAIGHEPAGVIAEIGKDVKDWKPGDRVIGFFGPGFSQFAVADTGNLVRIPEGVLVEHARGEPLACGKTDYT